MKKHFLLFGTALALVAILFTSTVFMNASVARAATPHRVACDQGWVDDNYALINREDRVDGSTETIVNNTDQTITRTVSTTTTVSVSISAAYTSEISITEVIASEKASLGITVQGTVTIARGETTTIPVGPHKSVEYGEYIRVDTTAYHHYYQYTDCHIGTDRGYVTVVAPEKKFWKADNI